MVLEATKRLGWLQKLRSVMIRPGREHLKGRVEVDEAFIGGQKEGARGQGGVEQRERPPCWSQWEENRSKSWGGCDSDVLNR